MATDGTTDIDALFQRPLGEFTAARNELAASLRKAGTRDQAEHVKGLAKPSVSAWAVNQLFWRHRAVFDRLMTTGDELRRAQAAQLAGKAADLRRPLDIRRETLAELSRLAAAELRGMDHQPTPDMMRRITTTLEALSTYGTSSDGPAAGRLTVDVAPPGFDSLAALVPRQPTAEARRAGPSSVIPFRQPPRQSRAAQKRAPVDERALEQEREARRAAARQALQDAERARREARSAAARAEAALKAAARRVKTAEAARADAEARLETAAAELTAARQAARQIASEAEDAAQMVTDAERTLERTRQTQE